MTMLDLISRPKLFNTIYETGEWPKDFTEVTMIALKKKTQATKFSDNRTISLISHTTKIIAKILRRRIERKIEDVLGEDQFGFRRGKGTRNAIGMMRIIAERTLEIDEELCICFIDWQKAFDRVNWTKLMQILKMKSANLNFLEPSGPFQTCNGTALPLYTDHVAP